MTDYREDQLLIVSFDKNSDRLRINIYPALTGNAGSAGAVLGGLDCVLIIVYCCCFSDNHE